MIGKIGERIKARREELGWSQDELAEKMGYKYRSSINKIEKGKNDVTQSKIVQFADVMGVTVKWLLGFEEAVPLETKILPILGSVSCGKPVYADQVHGEFVVTDNNNADFGLYAKGDSMIGARIFDGDLVLCKQQDSVNDGEIAVVCIGDEATLKRFYYYPDMDLIILRADNPAYKEMTYQGEDINQIRVIGKAVGVQFPL